MCKQVCASAHVTRVITCFAAMVCPNNDRKDGISFLRFFLNLGISL